MQYTTWCNRSLAPLPNCSSQTPKRSSKLLVANILKTSYFSWPFCSQVAASRRCLQFNSWKSYPFLLFSYVYALFMITVQSQYSLSMVPCPAQEGIWVWKIIFYHSCHCDKIVIKRAKKEQYINSLGNFVGVRSQVDWLCRFTLGKK